MKRFELCYLCLEPFFPPLYRRARRELRAVARARSHLASVLDAGGRKSHYTIGVPADITIMDLPRTSELQSRMHLGIDEPIKEQVMRRRSNVSEVIFEDMTQTSLGDASFDCVVAVEVLEHVERDDLFLKQAERLLKPGGTFLMTTPNGDYVANNNPDHKRHYTREALVGLLTEVFGPAVEVGYAVRGGFFRKLGLASWSPRRPLQTAASMAGNFVNSMQSRSPDVARQPVGTHHLFAQARKRG